MVFFNYALRKLNAKIVYYGPGLCGKTTNLQWIHDNFEGGDKGKMVSLATEGDRTIFFDLLPLEIGKIRGMDVTLQLYTVPGQVHYNSTRQLVLRGADGVVFVADSQSAMQSSNADSLKNLEENLGLQGVDLPTFPHVLQFNKRDLSDLMPVEDMDGVLNHYDAPFFEAVAVQGIGVQETLEGIVRLVMRSLRDRYEGRKTGSGGIRKPTQAETPPAPPAPMPPPAFRPPPPVVETPPPAAFDGTPAAPQPPAAPVEPAPPRFEASVDVDEENFANADTHSDLLTPADEAAGSDVPHWPADAPPEGPGEPVGGDASDVWAAEYDTAKVKEQEPDVVDTLDRTDEVGIDSVDEGQSEAPMDPVTAEEENAPAQAAPGGSVDDLVASVLNSADPLMTQQISAADLGPSAAGASTSEEPLQGAADQPGPDTPAYDSGGDEGETRLSEETGATPDSASNAFSAAAVPTESVDESPQERLGAGPPDPFSPQPVVESGPAAEPVFPASETVSTPESVRGDDRGVVVLDDEDPFGRGEWEIEQPGSAKATLVAQSDDQSPVSVSTEDNSLALKLSGTGAIVERGQVRALDLEVPVPGAWVGNRRVTLQLRLTLTPAEEEEHGG